MLALSSLPTELYHAAQVREMDRIAIEDLGIDGFELMQRAARFTLRMILKRWPDTERLTILCGGGNNGGDGYVIASLGHHKGIDIQVRYLSSPDKLSGSAAKAFALCREDNLDIAPYSSNEVLFSKTGDSPSSRSGGHVIVDAMLGTGLNNAVRGDYQDAIATCNEAGLPVMAVDIPSGLSADQGQPLGLAVQADATATFIGLKLGLFTGDGRRYAGDIYYDDLKVPESIFGHFSAPANILKWKEMARHIFPRKANTHKGNCGHVLIIGGDHGYGGAVIMAAEAAARMGAGLVSVATQAEHCAPLLARRPEIMVHAVSNSHALKPMLSKADVLIIGPGLGQSPWSEQMLTSALQQGLPTLLDADALNLLSEHAEWLPADTSRLILTPHPGEAARLLQLSTREVQQDRLHAVQTLQHRYGGSVLLKGSGSLLAHPDGEIHLCANGNPGMASGGMGDVLSGLTGGILAQGFEAKRALNIAVTLHACAADLCAMDTGERGMLASDLISKARALLNGKVRI